MKKPKATSKEGTGETIVLETENNKKDLLVVAKKKLPRTPYELL
jgi:hypothetical protein